VFEITIPVKPKPKQSTRFGKFGAYGDKKVTRSETDIRWYLLQAKAPKITGPVKINLIFGIQKPKKFKKGLERYPVKPPDYDNLSKLVSDAAEGILYDNDKQICDAHVKKIWADAEPYIYICVQEL